MNKFVALVSLGMISMLSAGCQLLGSAEPSATVVEQPKAPTTVVVGTPNPKPRPKQPPSYPSAQQLVQWHAQQCGGFAATAQDNDETFIAEPQLKQFFARLCLRGQTQPQEMLAELEVVSAQYYWPESSARYFWLLKQQLIANAQMRQELQAQKQEQAQMKARMQKTLSSLAAIEQQLLQRSTQQESDNEY
ncbi:MULTISPECIES: hypothetical protein [Pseudoalteromonas]|uniref:hypothetical protein n=1 Tax=Pseudoalteromonas TaxID=53246 RepID=UPI0003470B68|nr:MULTISPECIES: hypothetical protein [Pseudoalteromonas]MCF2862856.1 hypothetical protein [Pseudoalteromonas sp. CNAT2-18]MCG7543444.1 hypothetical protein [Pseudoalteromonas sp. MM17-2]MCG7558692.1 hypothetical protein [Pseudoalteromonas sp. CNAT2-18.1]MCG7567148.1 hypothetical protein [Pseudoalteromonas sp. CnMc7-15]MCG7570728.1 hypothetical protein [Pseudoalteromonas sp. CNC9-20]